MSLVPGSWKSMSSKNQEPRTKNQEPKNKNQEFSSFFILHSSFFIPLLSLPLHDAVNRGNGDGVIT
ncbi:MAG TPA: hypothetical protein PKE58_06275, partial [Acidobacteriota bacterium]|nr:hypothetical protein [Acidobacteriota bacterium]